MTPEACYAGIIVSDLERSVGWYREQLSGAAVDGPADGWAKLRFGDGSEIELVEGDPARPGLSFPSYGSDAGPPVLPGYGCAEPDAVADGLPIARQLPGWIVVISPDGLRLVLSGSDSDERQGVVAFRYTSPDPQALESFLARLGVDAVIDEGPLGVVPVLVGGREATLTDPDGTTLVVVRGPAGA